jgi:hypothetical protein
LVVDLVVRDIFCVCQSVMFTVEVAMRLTQGDHRRITLSQIQSMNAQHLQFIFL